MRGRDVKKYTEEWAGLWLISTHNGDRVADKDIKTNKITNTLYYEITENNTTIQIPITRREPARAYHSRVNRVDVTQDYPAIYAYLQQFRTTLEKRQDKGEHWTNLRNCTYARDFMKDKIIYPNMTLFLPFIYDTKQFIANQKCFILVSSSVNLKYLTGVLNSKLAGIWIREKCPELQGGTRELRKIFFENIPIATPTIEQETQVTTLVTEILAAKAANPQADTRAQEAAIDSIVYELYGLTAEEIAIIGG